MTPGGAGNDTRNWQSCRIANTIRSASNGSVDGPNIAAPRRYMPKRSMPTEVAISSALAACGRSESQVCQGVAHVNRRPPIPPTMGGGGLRSLIFFCD